MWCGSDVGRQRRLKSDGDCLAYDEEYRIVVVGAAGVGKSSICQTYINASENGQWERVPMIQKIPLGDGSELCSWDTIDGQSCYVRLHFLETQHESHTDLLEENPQLESLMLMADGFLLVFSVADRRSFDAMSKFHRLIADTREYTDTPLVLAGHKSDSAFRHVSTSEGRDAAFDIGESFYETSVVSEPEAVKHLFHDAVRQVRAIRSQTRIQEQTCTRVRGLINRLSLKSKRKRSRSRSRLRLMSSQQTL